jgi:hypothetical protein
LGGEMSKTHAEIRNENLERELFNITEEMKQAMEIARIKHIEELPDIEENKKIERNNFRLRHINDLPDLFTQIVMMCKELGLIGFEHLAVDGEKIQANASFKKSKNINGIEKEYKKIKEGMEKLLDKDVNEYFTEEIKEKRLQRLSEKLDKLETFKKHLEEIGDKKKE